MSFAAHWLVVLCLVLTSAEASPTRTTSRAEDVVFQRTPETPRPPVPTAPEIAAPPPVREVAAFTAPLVIPDVIPEIDLGRAMTDPREFAIRRIGTDRDSPVGDESPGGLPGGDAVLTAREVEQSARVAGEPITPVYPDALRRAGVEGEVLVSFVVDTLGRAEPSSFTVLRATHELFAQAVRAAVARQRFDPARLGFRPVRQIVQQPFSFTISR
jgi:protein TonB